ncbi:IS256 family transposase [Phaeacidiphilus oryzae]|nr:IS256 family transposase [Phaeacidiphilus oryzae]
MGTRDESSANAKASVQTGAELAQQAELDREMAQRLVERARSQGVSLTGQDGLLKGLVKLILEGALEAEMTDHLGYARGEAGPAEKSNSRNGSYRKTVRTDIGEVELDVPRDRAGSFTPQVVPKHQRRISGFDETVISLYAKGLTTGEIQDHLAQIYDMDVSRDLISRATGRVSAELEEWRSRPLDSLYAVVMIDALVVKVRDGAVANRPIYLAVGINLRGERDVLGMWAGTGAEGAKQWMTWLTELRNRGVGDVLIACCDGLKGLPDSINAVWPLAEVQLCVVHMVRAGLRYVSRKHWATVAKELREVYTAPTVEEAERRFAAFEEDWGDKAPGLIATWRRNWEHFETFLKFPPPVRKIVYTTNMIESINARLRRAVDRRGHFPSEDAVFKVLYLVLRDRHPRRTNPTGRTRDWMEAVNTLAAYYGDRVTNHQ